MKNYYRWVKRLGIAIILYVVFSFTAQALAQGLYTAPTLPVPAKEYSRQVINTVVVIGHLIGITAIVCLYVFMFKKGHSGAGGKQPSVPVAHFVVTAFYIAIGGTAWDLWWHIAVGRDSTWIPPHLVVYGALLSVGLVTAYHLFFRYHIFWKKMLILLLSVIVAFIADEVWHRVFGVEKLHDILLAWSPSHVLIEATLATNIMAAISLVVSSKEDKSRHFFAALGFAGLLIPLFFALSPLDPLSQWKYPWSVLGYWGAASTTFALSFVLISSQQWLKVKGIAFQVAAFFLVLHAMTFGNEISPLVTTILHQNPPIHITIMAFLVSAGLADVLANQKPILRGGVIGLVYGAILYILSWFFLNTFFRYGTSNMLIAIGSSFMGGLFGALLANTLYNKRFFNRLLS